MSNIFKDDKEKNKEIFVENQSEDKFKSVVEDELEEQRKRFEEAKKAKAAMRPRERAHDNEMKEQIKVDKEDLKEELDKKREVSVRKGHIAALFPACLFLNKTKRTNIRSLLSPILTA